MTKIISWATALFIASMACVLIAVAIQIAIGNVANLSVDFMAGGSTKGKVTVTFKK